MTHIKKDRLKTNTRNRNRNVNGNKYFKCKKNLIITFFIGANSKSSFTVDIMPWTLSFGIAKPKSR